MRNRFRWTATVVVVLLAWAVSPSAWAESVSPENSSAEACKSLESADFSQIPDAPTQITGATLQAPADGLPSVCVVKGYVTPAVGIELRLPIGNWNQKFLEVGCGGFCGTFAFSALCKGPLRKGYACIVSDMGHTSTTLQNAWAYNNLQAQVDYGYRSAHVAALAGKAITEEYYHRVLARSYFFGCSTGGHEGLLEAQRFPWDFDGMAIGGALNVNLSGWPMDIIWAVKALTGKDGKPIMSAADAQLLHQAVIAKCDMDDGLKDGIISNPAGCKFDPEILRCKRNNDAACLSGEKIEAIKKVYAGPPTSIVDRTYTEGALPGSELHWVPGDEESWGNYWGLGDYVTELFRYSGFWPAPGPNWTLADFDMNRDYKRLGMAASISNANNPDLRKYAALGGKIIAYFGLLDESTPELIEYHKTVERVMGGRAPTEDFFRLFGVPGMDHCTHGPGPFAIDYLSYLEAWVENGKAPDQLVGAHIDGLNWGQAFTLQFPLDPKTPVKFTRPVYPYPAYAKYKGTGDPNDARNFIAVNPK